MGKEQHVAQDDHVSLKQRIGWGFGGLADNYILNSFMLLAMPVYNIALGMDAVLLGWAMFIPRLLDAISDPLMGNISDNTRTSWGRRRPYIVAGTVLSVLSLPLLWLPPVHTDWGMFWYILILGSLYLTFYTMFVVPYTALGYELTADYHERTRVLAWRMYIGLFGSATVPSLYWLCLKLKDGMEYLPDSRYADYPVVSRLVGLFSLSGGGLPAAAFWMSIGMCGVILICGLLPAAACRERPQVQSQPTIHFGSAIICTLKNRPFMILCIVYVIIIFGLFAPATLGLYVNIYYVFGSKEGAAFLQMIAGPLSAMTSYVSMFLIARVSIRWDKRHAMLMGLTFTLLGVCSGWFTIHPHTPYFQLVSLFITCLGLQGCWLMLSSMVADVCDEDELQTGLRREGIYGAVNGLAMKGALAMTMVAGGMMLKFSGYDAKIAESAGAIPLEVALRMKMLMIGGQAIAISVAMVLFIFYPITRKRALQTRSILEQRRLFRRSTDQAFQQTATSEGEVLNL